MLERLIVAVLLGVHLLLTAWVFLRAPLHARYSHGALLLWMLPLPFFGAAVGWMLLHPSKDGPRAGEWLPRIQREHQVKITRAAPVYEAVPLEEALLINDPRRRRALMMNMLRADPRKFLSVLFVARFNDDPEIAHYATATLMETQRQTQLEIQRCQQALKNDPQDDAEWETYLKLLSEYCGSGFLEGQPLHRERLILAKALDQALALEETPERWSLKAQNHLALGEGQEAREAAQRMMALWPDQEISWLERMRVCAQTHDQAGMHALLEAAEHTPVDWTHAGQEKLQYWAGRMS